MSETVLIAIIVLVAAIIVLAYLWMRQRRRTKALRDDFGPEYDHAVADAGSPRKAENDLVARKERVSKFDIRPLDRSAREGYATRWKDVQAEFVDEPEDAANDAHELITEVMRARGYPISDFEQQSADLSVDHPVVVQNYRGAYEIATRHRAGKATTEDLRQAMVHFRTLFDELVNEEDTGRRATDPAEKRPFTASDPAANTTTTVRYE